MRNNIRSLREKNNITQAELSHIINISVYHLGAIEREEKHASLETLQKIAGLFDVTISEVIGEIPLGLGNIRKIPKTKVEGMRKFIDSSENITNAQLISLAEFIAPIGRDEKKV